LFEHDFFGKPIPTFPDHALAWKARPARAVADDGHAGRGRAGTVSISASGRDRNQELHKTVLILELSFRFATAPYQPVDTVGDWDKRKSRANDRPWSAMNATIVPMSEVRRRSIIQHIASSCGTCCRQHDKKDLEKRKHALFPFRIR
jgi:hypothetical protein